LEFFIDITLPATLWTGVDSVFNRNEYQKYFLVSKGGQCVKLITLPLSCADCHDIWELHPPGNLMVSPVLYGITVPLPLLNLYSLHDIVAWRLKEPHREVLFAYLFK